MNNKSNIAPKRLEQIKAIINNRAQWNLEQAQIRATNEDEAAKSFNDEVIGYMELFEALIEFTSNSFNLFDDLALLYDRYLRHEGDKKEQIFDSIAMVMKLAKEISNKEGFLNEQMLHFNNLADELETLMD